MPELPEVETTLRFLKPYILDQAIAEFSAPETSQRHFNMPIADLAALLKNAKFSDVQRRGKWMIFTLKPGNISGEATEQSLATTSAPFNLIGHLRMSGRFQVSDESEQHPHKRFEIKMQTGRVLNFFDQRRFSTWHIVDNVSSYKSFAHLGPDALTDEISGTWLKQRLAGHRKPIYSALLDQAIIAGLGNIYVNEALHAAGIHPLKPANELSESQLNSLISEAKRILNLALEMKGTTLLDNLYQDPEGKTGDFYKLLKVYGKKKDPSVQLLKIGGRSVFTKLPKE